ncbi:MAG: tetratricopeptide repeat protein [Acidobacteriota bacterium]
MQRSLLIIGLFLLLVSASCSGGPSDDANQNANGASEISGMNDANLALAEGSKFLDTGEIDQAIDALTRAVKLDPDLAEAWFKLGIAYGLAEKREQTLETTEIDNNTGDAKKPAKTNSEKAFEKAVVAYKKIIGANDNDDAAYFNLGRAYNKLNDDEDAAKALKQAVKLRPDDTEYQTELGAILIKLAQYREAIAPLKQALELDPENIRAQELLEDAEAGRSRVNYSSTPKDDKKKSDDNSNSNANTVPPPAGNVSLPPPTPDPASHPPKPVPSRSPKP